MSTSIEWARNADGSAGETWNPIRARNTATGQVGTHCVKVSPGCLNCYAEAWNARNLGASSSGLPYTAAGAAQAEYFIDPKILSAPLRRRKPTTYFVGSMTDLFMYPAELAAAVYGVMAACPQHTFQCLTKRPERAVQFNKWIAGQPTHLLTLPVAPKITATLYAHEATGLHWTVANPSAWPLPNVWLGVSAENRKHGLPRIDALRQIPAALRFLSVEPLLEDLGTLDLTGIGWVIVGGESGHGARPMHPAWVRSIRDQCVAARVPLFFFKQWGLWAPGSAHHGWTWVAFDGRKDSHPGDHPEDRPARMSPVGKKLGGRLLDGREWNEMPEVFRG